jgi:hypothetical protein
MKPWRSRLRPAGVVGAAVMFALATAAGAAAKPALVQVSADPYTNPSSQHRTQVEPDTLSYGSTVVSVFQTGRFYDGGASDIGWATSRDGGATWRHGFLHVTTFGGGPYARASDPVVAYDPKHRFWVVSYLGIHPSGINDVVVSRSSDGVTWSTPVPAVKGGPNSFYDKNWSVCDTTAASPHYGRCYTEYDDAGHGFVVQFTHSDDGGLTWSKPKGTVNHVAAFAGQPLVQPNGHVIVPLIGFPPPTGYLMQAVHSADGGATWSKPVSISPTLPLYIESTPVRNPTLPTAEIDSQGRVYVVWEDCRFRPSCRANDLVMSTSLNGISWTPVRRIPIAAVNSFTDEMTPSLAVDRSTSGAHARLGLVQYYLPDDRCASPLCPVAIGYVSSTNGGRTWSRRTVVAQMRLNWFPLTNQGLMYGDYTGLSIVPGGPAVPVVAVAGQTTSRYHAAMYSARLPVTGGAVSATATAAQPSGVSALRPRHLL